MALSATTFTDFGGAVNDLFAAKGYKFKAQGEQFEKDNYLEAAGLADQNAQFTENSTAIKQAQQDRSIFKTIGGEQSDVAGAGFAASGSALDIMRDSASQGALSKAVLGQQGLITEAGYKEQATSYRNLASAADVAIQADKEAETGSYITGGIKAISGLASLFSGGIFSGGGGGDSGEGGGISAAAALVE